MKYLTGIILLIVGLSPLLAQQTINGTIQHDGLEREYILYVPASYDPTAAVPLVLNFHGYGSNATEQLIYGNFRSIADTANFLVVHPLGTEDNNGTTHWNVGWGASTVDDVGFTNALLDTLSVEYNINQNRIYSTGMSNGGFMSYELACELSERIAAIASVTGTMNLGRFATCNPTHPMPVMEIHGTADAVVPYQGANWIEGSEDVVAFWADFNNTEADPVILPVPNTNVSDGSTAEQWVYQNGDNGTSVELFKIIDGAHTWPGSPIPFPGTNYDISASQEIWRFFSQYDINGLLPITSTEEVLSGPQLSLYPNPTRGELYLQADLKTPSDYRLTTSAGQLLQTGKINNFPHQLDLSSLARGIYFLHLGTSVQRIVKQ